MEKKNNGVVIGLLIGIILMLVVVFVLYFTGIISFSSKTSNSNAATGKSIKIDDSKYYVYDALYSANTKYQEYGEADNSVSTTSDGFNTIVDVYGKSYLKDLIVPYVNINTADAKDINDNLKKLYDEYVAVFNQHANAYYGSNGIAGHQILKYYTYESNGILSIIVTYGSQETDVLYPEYLVYNFDLTSGSLLNYNQFLSKFNLNASNAYSTAENQIISYINQLPKEYGVHNSITYGEKNTTSFDLTKETFKKSVDDGTVLYFIDSQGNINYIVDIYMNVGRGNYPQKITIAK